MRALAVERIFQQGRHFGRCLSAQQTLFAVGVFVAFLTTFYMFRLVFVVFWERRNRCSRATPTSPLP